VKPGAAWWMFCVVTRDLSRHCPRHVDVPCSHDEGATRKDLELLKARMAAAVLPHCSAAVTAGRQCMRVVFYHVHERSRSLSRAAPIEIHRTGTSIKSSMRST
jgi:hypothetical protein